MEAESDLSHRISSDAKSAVKILVVEDNLTNQKVIAQQLQSLGHEVDIVSHGQAALDATAQTFYPIVFMDCRLPGIDGCTATRLIRQREQQLGELQKTVIIALTASDEPQVQDEAIAAGMDDFLTKPLRRETLATTLQYWARALDKIAPEPAQDLENLTEAPSLGDSIFSLDAVLIRLGFDSACLHQLSDHNLEFEQELLQLYLDDTQDQLQQLQQASEKLNLLQIERIAHHIKGASASVGAKSMRQIATTLEQEARWRQLETIPALISKLSQTFKPIQLSLNFKKNNV